VVQRHADQYGVDVGGDHLRLLSAARGLPLKNAAARQHPMDDRVAGAAPGAVRHDKVAYRRVPGRFGCLITEPAGNPGKAFAVRRDDFVSVFILRYDSRQMQVGIESRL